MLLQYYFSSYEIPRYYILPQRQTRYQKCRSAHWCLVFDFDEELPICCRYNYILGMNFTRGNPCVIARPFGSEYWPMLYLCIYLVGVNQIMKNDFDSVRKWYLHCHFFLIRLGYRFCIPNIYVYKKFRKHCVDSYHLQK